MQTLTEKHKESLKLAWIKRKEKGLGTAWNKGMAHSEEHKKALSLAWIKRKEKGLGTAWNKGKELSESHKASARVARLGKKHSEETKKIMSEKHMGEKNHMWKGDEASYYALHNWVRRKKGNAKTHLCENCGEKARHWANIDHKYRRTEEDYIALCVKCHKKFDGYGIK